MRGLLVHVPAIESVPFTYEFSNIVAVDLCFLDWKGLEVPILNVIDHGTNYQWCGRPPDLRCCKPLADPDFTLTKMETQEKTRFNFFPKKQDRTILRDARISTLRCIGLPDLSLLITIIFQPDHHVDIYTLSCTMSHSCCCERLVGCHVKPF